jgi:hypothetical protein
MPFMTAQVKVWDVMLTPDTDRIHSPIGGVLVVCDGDAILRARTF